jgi:hypothetical protein
MNFVFVSLLVSLASVYYAKSRGLTWVMRRSSHPVRASLFSYTFINLYHTIILILNRGPMCLRISGASSSILNHLAIHHRATSSSSTASPASTDRFLGTILPLVDASTSIIFAYNLPSYLGNAASWPLLHFIPLGFSPYYFLMIFVGAGVWTRAASYVYMPTHTSYFDSRFAMYSYSLPLLT